MSAQILANEYGISISKPQNQSTDHVKTSPTPKAESKLKEVKSKAPDEAKINQSPKKKIEQKKIEHPKPKMSQVDAKKKIEEFKIRQNHEMLGVLEEEQKKEEEREAVLNKLSDEKEKVRLEKIFGMERAKAQQRIQHLSDIHDKEILELMKKLGIQEIPM